MRALLDTNVISELRKASPDAQVVRQVRRIGSDCTYLSSITIGELVFGIARLQPGSKREELEAWLLTIEQRYDRHILPVDAETARTWGELTARLKGSGRLLHIQDALIAATAIQHGMQLVTRNISDFEPTGASLINPWDHSRPR